MWRGIIVSSAAANEGAIHARAEIAGPNGVAGFATFTEDAGGVVHVNVKVSRLSGGLHGAHIDTTGVHGCERRRLRWRRRPLQPARRAAR